MFDRINCPGHRGVFPGELRLELVPGGPYRMRDTFEIKLFPRTGATVYVHPVSIATLSIENDTLLHGLDFGPAITGEDLNPFAFLSNYISELAGLLGEDVYRALLPYLMEVTNDSGRIIYLRFQDPRMAYYLMSAIGAKAPDVSERRLNWLGFLERMDAFWSASINDITVTLTRDMYNGPVPVGTGPRAFRRERLEFESLCRSSSRAVTELLAAAAASHPVSV